MPKRTKPVNPDTQFQVLDSAQKPITPPFFHEELAKAAQRELGKDHPGLIVSTAPAPNRTGGFQEAVGILTQENQWLEAIQKDKRFFQGLCEGWWSMREVAHG